MIWILVGVGCVLVLAVVAGLLVMMSDPADGIVDEDVPPTLNTRGEDP